MALSPEAVSIVSIAPEIVEGIVADSRNNARHRYSVEQFPWNAYADVRREGYYPLYTLEGEFQATLLRVLTPDTDEHWFRGAEFRVLDNRKPLEEGQAPRVYLDASPLFLKELSDHNIQDRLSDVRKKLGLSESPTLLVSNRASDVNDGEYRLRADGQLDIVEEQWYGKILTVMHEFPGMKMEQATEILIRLGHKPFLADLALGAYAGVQHVYGPNTQFDVEVIDFGTLLEPFPSEQEVSFSTDDIVHRYAHDLTQLINTRMDANRDHIAFDGAEYHVERLASYPLMQDGVLYDVDLIATQKEGEVGFKTFRVLRHGDQSHARVRIDSICVNGVQAGDRHCDCRLQTENEKKLAESGVPMMLVNMREDEGRGHGEGRKGGTLEVQRKISERLGVTIGNGIAAELFYHDTGRPIDARDFNPAVVVLKYMGVTRIRHLATNNDQKKATVRRLIPVDEDVSADVPPNVLHPEAQATKKDKESGRTGVKYDYLTL